MLREARARLREAYRTTFPARLFRVSMKKRPNLAARLGGNEHFRKLLCEVQIFACSFARSAVWELRSAATSVCSFRRLTYSTDAQIGG